MSLNPIADAIYGAFEDAGHDAAYVADKRDTIERLSPAQLLLWCNNLDGQHQSNVAARLGVSEDDFHATLRTLRTIMG